jgi:phytoene dehydrogenase-like protein
MPDKKYDAVIVGGGHHANILACYLAKAGLKTAMFERWHEMGGGACGEELPLPGFIMNPCAQWTRFYTHPAYSEFGLRDYGLVYAFPEYNEAWAFPDGRYILGKAIYAVTDKLTGKSEFSSENAQDLVNQFAQFSKHDAGVAEDIIGRYINRWKQAFMKFRFTGPDDWGDGKDPLEELYDDPKYGIDPKMIDMTIGEQAVALWESPELQTFYMRCHMTSHGLYPSEKCGIMWYIHVLALMLSMEPGAVAVGGSHSITHALLRAFEDLGGDFFVLHEVEKILLENGTAKGIRLTDGTEIKADVVISDLSINLALDMLGKENVPDNIWMKAQKFLEKPVHMNDTGYERTTIFWGALAMMEPPAFTCHTDMHLAARLYFGEEAAEYFLSGQYQREIWETGMSSKTYMAVASADHAYDPTRCPRGMYTQMIEEFCWPWRNWPERKWLSMNKVVPGRWLKEWARYAPNMTTENLIEAYVTTPDHVLNRNPTMHGGGWGALDVTADRCGRLRPFVEVNSYRLPAKNYYLCSHAAHSAHGIGRGSSYNCYRAIAKDLGLKYQPVGI